MGMNKSLKSVFQKTIDEPNRELAFNIWEKLLIRNKKITYFKIGAFSVFGTLSLVGLVPTINTLAVEFSKSGFYEYLSLLFSNNGELASYWKELTFSLAESLPVTEIIYTLLLVFVLFLSIKFVTKQIIKNRLVLTGSSILSI